MESFLEILRLVGAPEEEPDPLPTGLFEFRHCLRFTGSNALEQRLEIWNVAFRRQQDRLMHRAIHRVFTATRGRTNALPGAALLKFSSVDVY
jgi:hypothetical protein